MIDVIRDLNLRNVAGRVCYDLNRGYIGVPTINDNGDVFIRAPGLGGFDDDFRMKVDIGALIHLVSGSTVLSFNYEDWDMDIIGKESGGMPDASFLRLPWESLWIDIADHSRIRDFADIECTETYSWLLWQLEDYDKRRIAIIKYSHFRANNGTLPWGERRFSVLDSPIYMFTAGNDNSWSSIDFSIPELGRGFNNPKIWTNGQTEQPWRDSTFGLLKSVCFILNCISNVDVVKVAPANKIPKHERRYPRLEYHVLKLSRSNSAVSPKLEEQLRRSPRQHLRRGHLRQYQPGKYTWVPHCMVGSWKGGNIIKDYLV